MLRTAIVLAALLAPVAGFTTLLINEIAPGTSTGDWVELYWHDTGQSSFDISRLYVTMYYGTNEALATEPVTLYSWDRPETPYDDRYAVVYLTAPGAPDETDRTGDTNRNGRIDLYCGNYSGSLWNSDCVVAVDTDDDPSNGGMYDFCAYSNSDGSLNETILSYVLDAEAWGQWAACGDPDRQACMVDTGPDGVAAHMSIARLGRADTNGPSDFAVTTFQTPGRENIFPGAGRKGGSLFKAAKRKYTFVPSHPLLGSGAVELFVYQPCNIRFRVFNAPGLCVYESPLYRDVYPGPFTLPWDFRGRGRGAATGLYLGHIEATSKKLKKQQSETVYLIFNRYGR
ncbi:MAG TPA: hypothetical protein ENN21_04245 [Spirochaetes bacterium]|nr:hypothetical protein [Spirochaetota bacterium]